MKKLAFALTALAALSLLAPTPGSAEQATVGMYLDAEATIWESDSVAAPGLTTVYVCVVAHDIEAIYGYEFGYTFTGNAMISATTLLGTGPIDVGGAAGNHIVGLASPLATAPVTPICQLSVFLLDGNPVQFTLTGATPNSVSGSETPAILLDSDRIIRAGTSGWDVETEQPATCLTINEVGVVVSTDDITLDGIKSLYR